MKKAKQHSGFDDFWRYRANEMSTEERNAFERELQKDPFLQEAMEGLEQIPADELQSNIKELTYRISTTNKKRRYGWIAAAASVLILLSLSIFWLQLMDEQPLQTLSEVQKPETGKTEAQQKIHEPVPEQTPEITSESESKVQNTQSEDQKGFSEVEQRQPEKAKNEITDYISEPEDFATAEAALEIIDSDIQVADTEIVLDEQALKPLVGQARGTAVKAEDSMLSGTGSNQVSLSDDMRIAGQAKVGKNKPALGVKSVRGRVISAADKEPLAGVSILENGTKNGVITDMEGYFNLPLNDSNSTITASFVGMETKEIISADSLSKAIELEPSALALDEVVVTGYETNQEPLNSEARPMCDYAEYYTYLKSKALLPTEYKEDKQVVRLKVKLNRSGKIESFENLNRASDELFVKAKQIVLEGPAWYPKYVNGEARKSEIKLRIVFRKEK